MNVEDDKFGSGSVSAMGLISSIAILIVIYEYQGFTLLTYLVYLITFVFAAMVINFCAEIFEVK